MRFLVDAQLPPALARWLTERGHLAEHACDLHMEGADDRVLWDYAASVGAVMLSKDEDFAVRRTLATAGPTVVWIRLGNTRRRELLIWFAGRLPEMLEALERGDVLIEVV